MQKIKFQHDDSILYCDCYIAADDGFVSAIIMYAITSKPHGDVWIGAYYGSVGGGENDGGFFKINVENGTAEHLDYDEVDSLAEHDPTQAAALGGVMEALWTLIEQDDGDLILSELGTNIYVPDQEGIWMGTEFDGDSLDKVSEQWKIGLRFVS